MTSETSPKEQNDQITKNDTSLLSNMFDADQSIELNIRIRNNFMSYCFSFLQDNEETHQCVQSVWNKYLQCVGDIAILAAFFDALPVHVKASVLPKYQTEIVQWCENLFHINCNALLCSTYYSETFQRVIRYASKSNQLKKGIIYIPIDFDPNLKIDLTASLPNIKFEHISNNVSYEDLIDINQLEEFIQRDLNDTQSYPFMVIANAGSSLLGHCDQLTRINKICGHYNIWLHVIGDLLGSMALLPSIKDNVNINCDSLTIDIMKLFGIQNLPYLTFFLQPTTGVKQIDDNKTLVTTHPLYDFILHSPSISFLSVWSISQRCSHDTILSHMKQSFDLTNLLIKNLKDIKRLRILNEDNDQEVYTYQRICSGDASNQSLPKPVVIFRYEPDDLSELATMGDSNGYIDLLNLWLFDKLSQQYPKMNLELLKSVHFQILKSDNMDLNQTAAHAIRFAPLEHLLDNIDHNDMQSFIEDIQCYTEILLATMNGRKNLASIVSKYENLICIPMPQWAGVGAVRYIPNMINPSETNQPSTAEINTIQAELARQLQSNDSAFSLGVEADEHDSMFYLRLGMIRKSEDLDVLLQKVLNAGKETEASLKYVEDMAEKIRTGIEKVQRDLKNEDLQLLAQEGLLRQLPLISNVMSWWSPTPSTSMLGKKGRSFDLNSGRIESTEDTYVYRMQVKKQSPHAPMHNNNDITPTNTNTVENATESNTKQ
ncbi:unnamed protein product [Rotaria magnacalcarata]|uniref:Pyridoxal-dependent decarboxylase domain-containing protein 1 n=1 Tax=Rotaria magnacalcarata TaxID=392030 RepID=A0A816RUZ5_9BILA|nr:unnamed protein product [Rotaria magnacalcarata]CAF2086555.1 unnamed protein product [Rotaria magnacalcarata]